MTVDEIAASLVMVTLPGALPELAGANVTVNVASRLGVKIMPEGTPLALYPAPETVRFEMVTLEVLGLLTTTCKVAWLPMFTVPKFKLDGVVTICPAVESTANRAGLLVTVPAALLTRTVNTDPLSVAATVAGVV